jgi:type III secretion system FlhB-like substrate exporter
MQGILTMLGAVINIVAVGVGVVCKVIVEIHEDHGMDIRTGKLITHAK